MHAKVHTHMHECVLCIQAHIKSLCPPKPGVPGFHLSYDPQKSHLWLLHPALELCGLLKMVCSHGGYGVGLNATAFHQGVERKGQIFSV